MKLRLGIKFEAVSMHLTIGRIPVHRLQLRVT